MENKSVIVVSGCDDAIKVLVDATEEELAVLEKFAAVINAYGGGCKPTFSVMTEDAFRQEYTCAYFRAEVDNERDE